MTPEFLHMRLIEITYSYRNRIDIFFFLILMIFQVDIKAVTDPKICIMDPSGFNPYPDLLTYRNFSSVNKCHKIGVFIHQLLLLKRIFMRLKGL